MLPQVNLIRANNGDFLAFYEKQGISAVLTQHGVWDPLTIAIAQTLVDVTDVTPTILDIGANLGTFTVPLAKHIAPRGGKIYSFEPQRIVFYQLCGNVFLNRLDNAYPQNIALSGENGRKQIPAMDFHAALNIGGFSLVPGQDAQERLETTDPCVFERLDDFDLPSKITMIKIDVEGMEMDVFRGALKRIEKDGFPPILFESLTSDARAGEVRELLTGLGYKLLKYANEDWLAQHPHWPTEITLINNDNGVAYAKIR
jgi:FkbM family methyltransferase